MNSTLAWFWHLLLSLFTKARNKPIEWFKNTTQMMRRFWTITSPFWFPKGWKNLPEWFLLVIACYFSYQGLQWFVAHIDQFTALVVSGLKLGYGQFLTWYVLPSILAGGTIYGLSHIFWPKNKHHEGLLYLFLLILLMFSVNVLNVILNFANGAITDALNLKNQAEFYVMITRLCACFVVGTFIVVLYSYVHSKLNLCWRSWLTDYYMQLYFKNRNYYRINHLAHVDNPDERIANDVDSYVAGAGNIVISLLGGVLVYTSFMPILREVDPTGTLPVIAIFWSLGFTILAILVGYRLVGLSYNQSRYEADYRYGLIHIRNNTEAIALYQGEKQELTQVRMRFANVLNNWSSLIGWNRNLGFIQTGSDYFTAAIPFFIIAPLYFAGTVEMGSITRAAMAFGQVLTALTLIVSEFRSLSFFTANINRLAGFTEALEANDPSDLPGRTRIKHRLEPEIALENMTLMTPDWSFLLVKDMSLKIKQGESLVVMGPSGSGKSSLLRAIAGLWHSGKGTIANPALEDMMFLPQKPYMPLGSLRTQLLYPRNEGKTDEELERVLRLVNLPDLAKRHGGFDTVLPWAEVLSLGEQQRVAFARLLLAAPRYAILDEATSALDVANEEHLYELVLASGTTLISVGHRQSLLKYHKRILELTGKDGAWKLKNYSGSEKNE